MQSPPFPRYLVPPRSNIYIYIYVYIYIYKFLQSVQINTTWLNINAFFRSFVTCRLHYFAIFSWLSQSWSSIMSSSGMFVPRHRVIVARHFDTTLETISPVIRHNITEERRSILNFLAIILHLVFF